MGTNVRCKFMITSNEDAILSPDNVMENMLTTFLQLFSMFHA